MRNLGVVDEARVDGHRRRMRLRRIGPWRIRLLKHRGGIVSLAFISREPPIRWVVYIASGDSDSYTEDTVVAAL